MLDLVLEKKVKKKIDLLICTPLRENDKILKECYTSIRNQLDISFIWFSYSSKENASVNRNKCFEKSVESLGYIPKYVLFTDYDISWQNPFSFKNLRKVLKKSNNKIAFSYCTFAYQFSDGRKLKFTALPFDRISLWRSNYISTMSMIKTKYFIKCGKFNEKLKRFQDWELWLRLAFDYNKKGKPVEDVENIYFTAYTDLNKSISGRIILDEEIKPINKIKQKILDKYLKNKIISKF